MLVEKYFKYFVLGKWKLFNVFISHKPRTAVGSFQLLSKPFTYALGLGINFRLLLYVRIQLGRVMQKGTEAVIPDFVHASAEFRYCIHKGAEINLHFPQNLI